MSMKKVATITCCSPGAPPLRPKEFDDLSSRFKALADPTRLAIVNRLASSGDTCVCEFSSLGLAQPTISHHLRVLRDAGLVTVSRRGTWSYYAVDPRGTAAARAALDVAVREAGRAAVRPVFAG